MMNQSPRHQQGGSRATIDREIIRMPVIEVLDSAAASLGEGYYCLSL